MTALRADRTFRANAFQQRIKEDLVGKYGVSPFEIMPWVREVMEYAASLLGDHSAADVSRRMQTDKGVYPIEIYTDFMRKFKKSKKDSGKLWERGANEGVREQANTDFQIQYIMNNVFPGQQPGPEGERDRLRTCLYYPVRASTYRN